MSSDALRFSGHECLRTRLVLSTLANRPVRISEIRQTSDQPGLRDHEASLIRLFDKITNGTRIEISFTGTSVSFRPGVIHGGRIQHDCGTARAIGYYLEALVALAPFAKRPVHATLTGITNDGIDQCVDSFRNVTLPLLRAFGVDEDVEIKITKRGAPPLGGGEVVFSCPIVRALRPIDMTEAGMVKRVRGIAYSMRVSPETSVRLIEAVRSPLHQLLPDVFMHNDHYKGSESGRSPGWGVSLVAETINGQLLSIERAAERGEIPEDVGHEAALLLCEEIARGGCVDTQHQSLALLLMVLSPEDVSRIRLGKLSPFTIHFMRHLRSFFGTVFKVRPDSDSGTVVLSCKGSGYANVSRKLQ